jgi:tetratricopeptide (TPR) repeat protein
MEAASRSGTPVFGSDYAQQAAFLRYLQHDVRAGDADLRRYAQMLGYVGTKSLLLNPGLSVDKALAIPVAGARVLRADALEDRPTLVAGLREGWPVLHEFIRSLPPKGGRDFSRGVWPLLARPMIDAGMAEQAWAVLQGLPEDCYPCVVARGRVAAALGRRAEAEGLFAQAKRLGPSLPQADEARGRMLLAAGDSKGALRAFQQSISTETRFADAHEGAGEAFAALRDWSAAAREYASAAKLAPQWGKLHIRWAAALWNSGQRDEARSKLTAASPMELSAADRRLLSHLRAVAHS